MAVQIICDSGCDISKEDALSLNVRIIPLKVSFGDEEYLDGVNLAHSDFYEKLIESDDIPKTSQITPFEYETVFNEYTEKGDDVICFTLSGGLSGCYQSANVAAADFDNVHIIDTQSVSVGERMLIELAIRYRDEGLLCEEIVKKVEETKPRLKVLALLDTLEYLKRGGRISSAAALAGELLSIKPVLTVEDGKVVMVGRARGSKNGNNILRTLVEQSGGIDFSLPHCVAYGGLSDKLMMKYLEDSKSMYENEDPELRIFTIGSAIGTHLGPGAIAVVFFTK